MKAHAPTRPVPVRVDEPRRVDDQASDEDNEEDDSATERVDKHGEPIERTQAAEAAGEGEAEPGLKAEANVSATFECESSPVAINRVGRAQVGGVMR